MRRASYCHAVMALRKRWPHLAALGILLFGLAALLVAREISRHREESLAELRGSCLARAAAFARASAEWHLRDDAQSIEAAGSLFLLGTGQYLDLVIDARTILQRTDPGFVVDPVDPKSLPPAFPAAVELNRGTLEVRQPVTLPGYPDSPIGLLRMGFSAEYVSDRVQRSALVAVAVAIAGWVTIMGVAIVMGVQFRPRKAPRREDERAHLRCGELLIDLRSCEVRYADTPIELTPKLFDLLVAFARSPGAVLSDDALLRVVWPESPYATSADVKQHIYLLRRRFAVAHADPKNLIQNVKGFGYRLVEPNDEKELTSA